MIAKRWQLKDTTSIRCIAVKGIFHLPCDKATCTGICSAMCKALAHLLSSKNRKATSAITSAAVEFFGCRRSGLFYHTVLAEAILTTPGKISFRFSAAVSALGLPPF